VHQVGFSLHDLHIVSWNLWSYMCQLTYKAANIGQWQYVLFFCDYF